MEDVHIEALGDAPWAASIRELRHTFIEDAGSGERKRAVDDIGMAGDPADVGHAPVDIFGMNVLIKLGSAGDVCEVTTSAVLTTLRFAVVPLVYMRKRGSSASMETGSTM